MLCPKCGFKQADGNSECNRCGIIFSKYSAAREAAAGARPRAGVSVQLESEKSSTDLWNSLLYLLFRVDEDVNVFYFAGRVAVFLLLLFYFVKYLFTSLEMAYDVMSFMHLINLPFHEAGHIIFSPFGRFIMFLGGTLGQLLIPLICTVALLLSYGQNFGAAMSLWWFAQNFLDVAPYINDARALNLILLGGVTGKETDGLGKHPPNPWLVEARSPPRQTSLHHRACPDDFSSGLGGLPSLSPVQESRLVRRDRRDARYCEPTRTEKEGASNVH